MTYGIRTDASGNFAAITSGTEDVMRFGGDNSGQLAGFRNVLINGGMRVAQYGAVSLAAVNTSQYGGSDRWLTGVQSGVLTIGTIFQNTPLTTSSGYAHQLTLTGTTFGDVLFSQRIESNNVHHLNSKSVTLSLKTGQNTGSALTLNMALYKADAKDNFTTVTPIGATYTQLITSANDAVSITPVTWALGAADANNGLQVSIWYSGVGSVTAKSFFIGDAQLEEGSIATPFENRPIGVEEMLCKRYCQWVPYDYQGAYATAIQAAWNVPFKTEMRASPSMSALSADPARTPRQLNVTTNTFSETSPIGAAAYIISSGGGSFYTFGYRSLASSEL